MHWVESDDNFRFGLDVEGNLVNPNFKQYLYLKLVGCGPGDFSRGGVWGAPGLGAPLPPSKCPLGPSQKVKLKLGGGVNLGQLGGTLSSGPASFWRLIFHAFLGTSRESSILSGNIRKPF